MPFLGPVIGTVGGLLGSFGAFLSSGTILASAVKLGLGLAAQYALGKIFAPKVPPQKIHLETIYGEDSPRFVVLGKRAVRGHHIFRNSHGAGGRTIEDVYILSHFRSAGVPRVRFEGEWKTLSEGTFDANLGYRIPGTKAGAWIWVKVYTGDPAQTADAELISRASGTGRWTTDHKLSGLTYAIVTQALDREDHPQPWADLFEVEGLCYDWREDDTAGGDGDQRWSDPSTWAPSENPIVQAYNLERGFFIGNELIVGKGVAASRLPLAKWTLAANISDESIGDPAGPRYASAYVAIAGKGATHAGNMEPILEAAAATWVEAPDGEWPIAGANQATVASITDDDLMVEEAERITLKRTRSELVNTISGTYQSPDTYYESAPLATTIDDTAFAADGERLAAQIDYQAVTSSAVGDRLNDIYVRASRYQASAEICLAPKHRFLNPGDWISWTSDRAGGFTKTYQVLSKRLGPLGEKAARAVYVTLQEVGAGIFDPTAYVTSPPDIIGPAAPDYLDEVANFALLAVELTSETGAKRAAIRATWAAITDPTVTHVILKYRTVEEPTVIHSETVTADATVAYLTKGVVGLTAYEVRSEIVTLPERTITPSAWYPVTTTDTRIGRVDLYDGVIDRDALADEVGDLVDWISGTGQAIPGDLATEVSTREAEIAAEVAARIADANALAERYRWVFDQLDGVGAVIAEQDYANYADKQQIRTEILTARDDLTAAYTLAITTAVGDGSAIAVRFEALEAEADALSASVLSETTARADADDALAQQITLLSAGSGDQFDWSAIWYFNTTVDGFTGNGTPTVSSDGFLRPANHGSDPYVISPDLIAVDGSLYRQVRARIRKTGSPTWEGYLWWQAEGDSTWDAGRRVTIAEPSFDAGIANITFNLSWTGTIDQIRLDLSTAQTDTDCYEIDWIAVGRPSPGASSAQLYTESQARISADNALALDITALTSSLNDLDGEVAGQATAISALETDVSTLDGEVSANTTAITAIEAELPGLASASALSALETEVALLGGGSVVSNSEAIVALRNEVDELGALVAEGQYADHQGELRVRDALVSATQTLTTSIEATDAQVAVNAAEITALQAALTGYSGESAVATAISALTASVTALDGETDSLSASIVSLQNALTGYTGSGAVSTAFSGLNSSVSTINSTLTSQGSDITALQSEVDLRARTFVQTSAPTADNAGDLWFDSDDGFKPYRWNGSAWVAVQDLRAARTFAQTSAPAATATGDLWLDTDDSNKLYRWNGSSWAAIDDSRIAANASAISSLTSTVSSQGSSISSQGSAITALQNALTGYTGSGAVSSAFSSLNSTVSSQGSTITSQGSSITSLQNALTGYTGSGAVSSAFSSLNSTVSSQGSTISSLSDALTAVETEVDGVTASGLFRMSSSYTPAAGWTSRIGMQARVGTGDAWTTAGLFLEAKTGQSRALILADQLVVADASNVAKPFVFEGGVLYLDSVVAREANIADLSVTSAKTQAVAVEALS